MRAAVAWRARHVWLWHLWQMSGEHPHELSQRWATGAPQTFQFHLKWIKRNANIHNSTFFWSKIKLLLHNSTYFYLVHLSLKSSAFWKISGLILTLIVREYHSVTVHIYYLMQKEFLVECGKYEAFKRNPLVLTDFEASPFYEGVRETDRSGLAPNLIFSHGETSRWEAGFRSQALWESKKT